VCLPNSQLGQVFNLLQLDPCPRGPNGVGVALGPQLGKIIVKQKLLNKPVLAGMENFLGPHNPDPEAPCPLYF